MQIVSRSRGTERSSRLGGVGSSLMTCKSVSCGVAGHERRSADEQAVQDGAERVDVAGVADLARAAGGLFGGGVAGGAEDGAGAGAVLAARAG